MKFCFNGVSNGQRAWVPFNGSCLNIFFRGWHSFQIGVYFGKNQGNRWALRFDLGFWLFQFEKWMP